MAESNIKLKDLVGNERNYNNIKVIKIPIATEESTEQEGEVEYAEYIQPDLQGKTITPTVGEQTVRPDEGYDALGIVTVEAVPYSETDNNSGGRTISICS